MLGGFSQGAVMSYALGLGRGPAERPAALLPLSGFMPRVEGLELDLTGLEGYPVAIAHGSLDPVISVEWSRAARDALTAAGADVAYHEAPLPHTIDPQIIPALRGFVASATPAASGSTPRVTPGGRWCGRAGRSLVAWRTQRSRRCRRSRPDSAT